MADGNFFSDFCATSSFIVVFTGPYSEYYYFGYLISLRWILILLSCLHLDISSGVFSSGIQKSRLYSCLSCTCYIPSPTHPWVHGHNILWSFHIMKLWIYGVLLWWSLIRNRTYLQVYAVVLHIVSHNQVIFYLHESH